MISILVYRVSFAFLAVGIINEMLTFVHEVMWFAGLNLQRGGPTGGINSKDETVVVASDALVGGTIKFIWENPHFASLDDIGINLTVFWSDATAGGI